MQEKHFVIWGSTFYTFLIGLYDICRTTNARAEVQLVVRGQRVTVHGDQQPTGELYGDLWTKVATTTHQGFIEGSCT